ncbi:hypothetical protein PV328_006534 [Microctonus aethiopoides]|uniref:Uncharacterized protein n=1 Tax=Microctonus aethiopoides TaxID=144406 RepID=A0AA39KTM4_9HYME|nr:hypothetical protein PV328_006534 [Microctonus aethiopoides]
MNSIYCTTFLIILVLSTHSALTQECVFAGKICNSDASCCGGCCINNICIDTYRSCIVHQDPCLEHDCPPGQDCYIFQPNCIGCEAYAQCRESEGIISPQAIRV